MIADLLAFVAWIALDPMQVVKLIWWSDHETAVRVVLQARVASERS